MEDQELLIGYVNWIIVIATTIVAFKFFTKRFNNLGRLLPVVLLSTWGVIAIVQGVENWIFQNVSQFSPYGFVQLLASTLPVVVVFGGITFAVSYKKYRKRIGSSKEGPLKE